MALICCISASVHFVTTHGSYSNTRIKRAVNYTALAIKILKETPLVDGYAIFTLRILLKCSNKVSLILAALMSRVHGALMVF